MDKFNLTTEKWIPTSEGLSSLMDVFVKDLKLGGNPVQKIAITKLLLAITQTVITPKDEKEYKSIDLKTVSEKVIAYLREKQELFNLYGENPFLQFPQLKSFATSDDLYCDYSILDVTTPSEDTAIYNDVLAKKEYTHARRAMLLIENIGMSVVGVFKNHITLSKEKIKYKVNDNGKPTFIKAGNSMGNGYLHSFVWGQTILETIWLNVMTHEQINNHRIYENGLGFPAWEKMPTTENCEVAEEYKKTYMFSLVPLSLYVLFLENTILVTGGIESENLDLSCLTYSDKNTLKARNANVKTKVFREILALLNFLEIDKKECCVQLKNCLRRKTKNVAIWSGGFPYTNKSGNFVITDEHDYVESEIWVSDLGSIFYTNLKTEMTNLEKNATAVLTMSVGRYYMQLGEPATSKKKKANQEKASRLFYDFVEKEFSDMIQLCNPDSYSDESILKFRQKISKMAGKVYDIVCPKDSTKSLMEWIHCRPYFSKYLKGE